MSNGDALKQAQEKVDALLEAAKKGMIIPVRLPSQIEEIADILKRAEKEQNEALQEALANAMPADTQKQNEEEAYFVGHAVHELRTPMTSIRGYSDMLGNPAMGSINDMQKQFLEVIRTNAKRMESLLFDVSYVNKIRRQTLKANKKMDMFKNIAMGLEKAMKPVATELGRELELDVPQGLPLINTDGELLTVALNKLIENALRYSPKDIGKVVVRGAADGNNLLITIEDNGIGMSSEDMARLGETYFRSDHDAVREYKGSGLGIPIAYGIFKLLGAQVQVESQPEQGTRFTIQLEGMT